MLRLLAAAAAAGGLFASTALAMDDPRLADPGDRATFRGWFTFFANLQFLRDPASLPREVADCAGLIRFAYRESLRKHDGRWAQELQLPDVPPLGSVRQFNYPFGAGLFRVRAGRWAEFADAQTLMRHNAYRVGRTLDAAAPADLLFFHQPDQRLPFHVMAYVGGRERHIVYHTGPGEGSPGEVRRPTVDELLRHPSPQWRPHPGNPNFLGVYRWDILRD
jgi:hypothetical protein